jgi:hypothetical protein
MTFANSTVQQLTVNAMEIANKTFLKMKNIASVPYMNQILHICITSVAYINIF